MNKTLGDCTPTELYAALVRNCGPEGIAEMMPPVYRVAPELLAACQMALEDVTGPITPYGIKIRFATRDALESAIKKVKGSQRKP